VGPTDDADFFDRSSDSDATETTENG